MPKRWRPSERAWAYKFIVLRDGEQCANCNRIPTPGFTLDIDHIDGNPTNKNDWNLQLLCRSCNVARENISRSIPSVREREREGESPLTRVSKQAVSYKSGSPEMQANLIFEVRFRTWLFTFIQDQGFIPKKEAINAGAEMVGCNPTTSAKYLAKLTSIAGPLCEHKDSMGEIQIIFREPVPARKRVKRIRGNGSGRGVEAMRQDRTRVIAGKDPDQVQKQGVDRSLKTDQKEN